MDSIRFENYKRFEYPQQVDFRPITIFIGKNSSGKSSLIRLPLLIDKNLKKTTCEKPIEYVFDDIDFGYEFSDLLYNKYSTRILKIGFSVSVEDVGKVDIDVGIQNFEEFDKQVVYFYKYKSTGNTVDLELRLDSPMENIYRGEINGVHFESIKVKFCGFWFDQYLGNIPEERELLTKIIDEHKLIISKSFEVNYIEPFRPYPERIYSRYKLNLFRGKYSNAKIPLKLAKDKKLLKRVKQWYFDNMELADIVIRSIDKREHYFEVLVKTNNSKSEDVLVNISDVGLGISQSLPIVVEALSNSERSLNIIEQPEIHLHPAAHGNLAELIATSVVEKKGMKFLIETHSENFLLRIRRLIAEDIIPHELVKIYWINENSSGEDAIVEINIDKYGEVDYWPEGIFSEGFEEVKAIRRAQSKG